MAFSCECAAARTHLPCKCYTDCHNLACFFFFFHYGSILLLSCKKHPACIDRRGSLGLKTMWPTTALCSIKKALSRRNADNFDPAVKEIKCQDRCTDTQEIHSLLLHFFPITFVLASFPTPSHLQCVFFFSFSHIFFFFPFRLQCNFRRSSLFSSPLLHLGSLVFLALNLALFCL